MQTHTSKIKSSKNHTLKRNKNNNTIKLQTIPNNQTPNQNQQLNKVITQILAP